MNALSPLKHWSRREELNLQPTHYECVALPLSYAGSLRGCLVIIAGSLDTGQFLWRSAVLFLFVCR